MGLIAGAPIVVVKDLTKQFGKTTVLQGINLSADRGTVLGVLGPNGAGKTTVINCLTTLLVPDGGQATIAGYDVVKAARSGAIAH